MGFDAETETLTALGTAMEVTVGQLKAEILATLKAGDLKRAEVLDQVSGKSQHVLTALGQLCDAGEVEKTGLGKRGDPFLYALVKNDLGKGNGAVSGTLEPENGFSSAFPNATQEEGNGIERRGGQLGDIDRPGWKRWPL